MSIEVLNRTTLSQLADAVVQNCLPVWFPRVATLTYFLTVALSLAQRVQESVSGNANA